MANTSIELAPYTIDADGRQWTVRKARTTEKGEPTSDILGYYGDLPGALRRVLEDGIGGLGRTTADKALAGMEAVYERLAALPGQLFKVEVTVKEVS